MKWIIQTIKSNFLTALWTLKQFNNSQIVQEFFIDCTDIEIRLIIIEIVKESVIQVYNNIDSKNMNKSQDYKAETPNTQPPKSLILNFFHILLQSFKFLYISTSSFYNCGEFFQLFYVLAKTSDKIAAYMIKKHVIGRFLDFIKSRKTGQQRNKNSNRKLLRSFIDVPI